MISKMETQNKINDEIKIPEEVLNNRKGTIYLGEGCEKINQAIYSSQVYGTFFGVDAVFEVKDSPDNNIEIVSIKLSAFNYKGIINVGLVSANWNNDAGHIDFYIRGMADPKKVIEVDFKGEKMIFEKGKDLVFMRNLKLLNVPDSGGNTDMEKLHVFDAEFFDRDGGLKFPKIRYEELEDKEIKENIKADVNWQHLVKQGNNMDPVIPNIPDIDDEKKSIRRPGFRCVPAILTIRY